eukprot:SAG31_NODE_28124_length_415_cov_0.810127_2_plen_57_part_01
MVYSCSNESVITVSTGIVLANETFFDGRSGVAGCASYCDCCHDYITDCDRCVNTRCL